MKSPEEVATVLAGCAADGLTVRARGGETKSAWGRVVPEADVVVDTTGLSEVVEYNPGDLTAVIRAGAPLSAIQAVFEERGQMLALDPPDGLPGVPGATGPPTIGGIMATNDSGPLRHHYGGVRDLVLGVTVVLSDGTVAKAGGKVIKNVAGYDLGKLFTGSFGTLGLIVEVAFRLHPQPRRSATATGRSADRRALAGAAAAVTHAPPGTAGCLDISWGAGRGAVLARTGGDDPGPAVERIAGIFGNAGLDTEITVDGDEATWLEQRRAQRSADGVVLKVSALPGALGEVLATAEAVGASVVGRAALGLAWLRLPAGVTGDLVTATEEVRNRLAPAPVVVLDAPPAVREKLDPWGPVAGPVDLMRRVKSRFDPAGVCRPGLFVEGI